MKTVIKQIRGGFHDGWTRITVTTVEGRRWNTLVCPHASHTVIRANYIALLTVARSCY